jgi:hypothetical protein
MEMKSMKWREENLYKILLAKPESNGQHGRFWYKNEDDIKRDLKEISCRVVEMNVLT